ncbi:C-methyltransferase-like protein [Tepidamorphus gemmatus]|uniref:C-methyltransferase-like protein n=1 Tax=Tepidamorphus gemmatus TaxID=747076 RepID=A0A4R3ME98_9HYPH|nr:class I SAM-dependent methyltransferase [Tepidamorphus gemmatus]TCT09875.1 C-methyltransferase-like protein [Tepidamorphus gemmatus]
MTCPVCGSADTLVFDRRARVPVHQNGLCPTRERALATPTGVLEMAGCHACGFAWNAAFEPGLLVYDAAYENDQTCSPAFRAHFAERAGRVLAAVRDLTEVRVVEVGCGQGDFLAHLAALGDGRITRATGFDPAWRGIDGEGPGRAAIHRRYYEPATAHLAGGAPDVIVSRHTIEHVPDPVGFLRAIRAAAGADSPVRIFLETPCIGWVIANGQMQDLFYEHCSIFTAGSLALALREAGFGPARAGHVFAGQYLWAEAGFGADDPAPATIPDFAGWEDRKSRYVAHWRGIVETAAGQGPVYLWGGGSKGVTFTLLIDPDATRLAGAVDINPRKQGGYLPVTGLPILAPEQLPAKGATVIVMNPAYHAEIEAQARAIGRQARFVPLVPEAA